jgi:hypothetical protein
MQISRIQAISISGLILSLSVGAGISLYGFLYALAILFLYAIGNEPYLAKLAALISLPFSSFMLVIATSPPVQAQALFGTTETKVKELVSGGTFDVSEVITKVFTFLRVIAVLIFLGAAIYSIFIGRQGQEDRVKTISDWAIGGVVVLSIADFIAGKILGA